MYLLDLTIETLVSAFDPILFTGSLLIVLLNKTFRGVLVFSFIFVLILEVFRFFSETNLYNKFEVHYSIVHILILKSDYEENTPYKQCRFCGKPNFDKRGEKYKFGKHNLHLCHVEGCITGVTNPQGEFHKEGCCFIQWKRIKKNFNQKLDRITGRLNNKNLINSKERAIDEFIFFCEDRFEHNKSLEYTIQTRNKSATKLVPFAPYDFEVIGTIDESYYD